MSFRSTCFTVCVAMVWALSGCQLTPDRWTPEREKDEGGFFGGDRPPDVIPVDLASVPDAVPEPLPRSQTGNAPYEVFGRSWTPLASAKGYRERGIASWYGRKFHGRRTSSGETYDMFAMTAAHPVLPLPTFVRVTSLANGHSVVVKVNDRGPFLHGRIIDLSYVAAWKLGITRTGTGRVEVVALDPSDQGSIQPTQPVRPQTWAGVAGASTPPPSDSPSPEEGNYMVQVGSFNDLDNALVLRDQLRRAGYDLIPVRDESLTHQEAPFQVIVGPFADWNRADQVRLEQERITGLPGLLREK